MRGTLPFPPMGASPPSRPTAVPARTVSHNTHTHTHTIKHSLSQTPPVVGVVLEQDSRQKNENQSLSLTPQRSATQMARMGATLRCQTYSSSSLQGWWGQTSNQLINLIVTHSHIA
jgi:hypothetical protein